MVFSNEVIPLFAKTHASPFISPAIRYDRMTVYKEWYRLLAVYRRIGLHRQILYPQPRRVRRFYQPRLLEAVDSVQIYSPLCQGLGTAYRTVITSKSFSPYPCAHSRLQTHRKESFNIDNIECLPSWIIWNNVFFENLYVFSVLFPDNYSYLCREYQQQLNIFSYLRTTIQLT